MPVSTPHSTHFRAEALMSMITDNDNTKKEKKEERKKKKRKVGG